MKSICVTGLFVLFSPIANAQVAAPAPCSAKDTVYFTGTALEDREAWYGRALSQMRESRLCPTEDAVVYRFLWLRSFHRPVGVRVTRTGAGGRVWLRVLDGAGGYDPGKISQDRSIENNRVQWDSLASLIDAATFWNLPTDEPTRSDTVNGQVLYTLHADGARWILEGVEGHRYHVVDRWSPRPEPGERPFYDLCRYLLTLSRLRLSAEEIY